EVEEGVGVVDNLVVDGGGSGSGSRGFSNVGAIAAGQAGFGRPVRIAPAELVGAVHPGQTTDVYPVVLAIADVLGDDGRVSNRTHLLSGSCTRDGGGGERESQSDF